MTQEEWTTVEPDKDPRDADWAKRNWDLPKPGTPEYDGLKRVAGGKPLRPSFPELSDGEDAPPEHARLPDLP